MGEALFFITRRRARWRASGRASGGGRGDEPAVGRGVARADARRGDGSGVRDGRRAWLDLEPERAPRAPLEVDEGVAREVSDLREIGGVARDAFVDFERRTGRALR